MKMDVVCVATTDTYQATKFLRFIHDIERFHCDKGPIAPGQLTTTLAIESEGPPLAFGIRSQRETELIATLDLSTK